MIACLPGDTEPRQKVLQKSETISVLISITFDVFKVSMSEGPQSYSLMALLAVAIHSAQTIVHRHPDIGDDNASR